MFQTLIISEENYYYKRLKHIQELFLFFIETMILTLTIVF